MNESEAVLIDETADVAEESNTATPTAAEATVSDAEEADPAPDGGGTAEEANEDEGAPAEAGVSDDPDADSDPDPDATARTDQADGLDELRGELKSLRAELARRDAAMTRAEREYSEFTALYPDTHLSELSDSVWKSVGEGVPLAAAYALEERRQELLRNAAELSNRENRQRSAGGHKPTPGGYFTPEEVRNMSQNEVRVHYSAILDSMKTWRN